MATPAVHESVPAADPADLSGKIAALAARLSALKKAAAEAEALRHAAEVREAVSRTDLTQALTAALLGQAEVRARLKAMAVARYFAPRQPLAPQTPAQPPPPAPGLRVWRKPAPASRPPAEVVDTFELPPLFDEGYYAAATAGEAERLGISPAEHYARAGARQGISPHPLFDMAHYAAQAPALSPGEDMVLHYVRTGWRSGLSPHPLFDPDWYAAQAGGAAEQPPLLHYLDAGWREGLSPHPLFDPTWYRDTYADVAQAGAEPLSHFLLMGAAEGRSPSPWFDLPHYVRARGEALAAAVNPLVDYLEGGAWAVAEPRPGFPTAAYVAAQPALARAGVTPLEHWARTAAG